MNIIFTVFIFIYSAIAFAQEQQQLNSAKVKTKTEYIYQFNKNGEIEEQGRFLSKTLYNKKGQTIEDSVVWTEGIWR